MSLPVHAEGLLSWAVTIGRAECLANAFSTSALGPDTPLLNCLVDAGAYVATLR